MKKVVKFGGSSLAQNSLKKLEILSVQKNPEDMLYRLLRESVFQLIQR